MTSTRVHEYTKEQSNNQQYVKTREKGKRVYISVHVCMVYTMCTQQNGDKNSMEKYHAWKCTGFHQFQIAVSTSRSSSRIIELDSELGTDSTLRRDALGAWTATPCRVPLGQTHDKIDGIRLVRRRPQLRVDARRSRRVAASFPCSVADQSR